MNAQQIFDEYREIFDKQKTQIDKTWAKTNKHDTFTLRSF